jgi:hypothetical protein
MRGVTGMTLMVSKLIARSPDAEVLATYRNSLLLLNLSTPAAADDDHARSSCGLIAGWVCETHLRMNGPAPATAFYCSAIFVVDCASRSLAMFLA